MYNVNSEYEVHRYVLSGERYATLVKQISELNLINQNIRSLKCNFNKEVMKGGLILQSLKLQPLKHTGYTFG